MTSLKILALSAALLSLAVWQPVLAGTASSNQTLVVADASAAPDDAAEAIDDMPASAQQGAWCLGAAAASLGAAYAIGPSEIVMMVSGAMHIPSSGPLLFIPLFSLMAGGSCALAAAAQPAVAWAGEQSDNIAKSVGEQFSALGDHLVGNQSAQYADAAVDDASKSGGTTIRPMQESEVQSTGCVAGSLGGFLASMASSPMEVVMLSAGGITVASSSPILAMGLLGTIMVSGCGIGNYAVLPIVAFFNNFSAIGDSIAQSTGQVGHMMAQAAGGLGQAVAALGRNGGASVQVAEGNAVAAH
jgi:hypothetical protein